MLEEFEVEDLGPDTEASEEFDGENAGDDNVVSPMISISLPVVAFALAMVFCVAVAVLLSSELPFPIAIQTIIFVALVGIAFAAIRKRVLPQPMMAANGPVVANSASDNNDPGEKPTHPVHSPVEEVGKKESRLKRLRSKRPTSADKIDAVNRRRGTHIPRSLPLARDEKVVVSERLHWMKLFVPVLVLVTLIVLFFYAPTLETVGFQILLLVPAAVYVVVPLVVSTYRFVKKVTVMHLLYTAATLVILGVMLRDNLGSILATIGNFLRDVAVLIGVEPQHYFVVLIILQALRLLIGALEWYINPAVGTDQRLIVIRGLIIHAFPSMQLDKMTDQNFTRIGNLPFGTLTLESAGQIQSLTKVRWFPVALYEEMRTGASIDEDNQ